MAETAPQDPVPGGRVTEHRFTNPPGSPRRRVDRWEFYRFILRRILLPQPATLLEPGMVWTAEAVRRGLAEAEAEGDCATWLGHAGWLLRLGGQRVLLDPFLSERASPSRHVGPKRFTPPPLDVASLPPIDVLAVSHNHYDHLDAPTLEALPGKERIQVCVPLGLGGFFRERGYQRVAELGWHESRDLGGLSVTALPAVHWSKRAIGDVNRTLWASFLLRAGGRSLFFSGDTAYGPVYPELGRRYGPVDVALLAVGAYAPRALMYASHMTPEEAVRVGRDLGARVLVAMHWGTIRLTDEPVLEPPQRFRAAAEAAGFDEAHAWVMAVGETRALWPAAASGAILVRNGAAAPDGSAG